MTFDVGAFAAALYGFGLVAAGIWLVSRSGAYHGWLTNREPTIWQQRRAARRAKR